MWLEPVSATRVEELRWTPDVDQALLGLEVRLARTDARALRLQVVLRQHGETSRTTSGSEPDRWSR